MAGQQLRAARRGVSNHRPFPRRSRRRHRASHLSSGTNRTRPDPPLPPRRRLGLRRSRAERRPLPAALRSSPAASSSTSTIGSLPKTATPPRRTTAMRCSAGPRSMPPSSARTPRASSIAGSSAGGNLAAAVTLMSRDRGGPRIAAQILVYPVLDDSCAFPSYRRIRRRATSFRPTRCAGTGGSISTAAAQARRALCMSAARRRISPICRAVS